MRSDYNRHRQLTLSREAEYTAAGQDIGTPPKVKDPKRRQACGRKTGASFRKFCNTYGALTFSLPWSKDHHTVTDRMVHAMKTGGKTAIGMPRSSGKTTLCNWFVVWCLCYGFKKYVVLVEATKVLSSQSLESIKTIFETNDLLNEDFPEICHAIRALEGSNRRSKGQHIGGKRTRIEWSSAELIFPTVAKSKASGSRLVIKSIESAFRGLLATTVEGESIRPDLIVINDPQTEESARNPERCEKLQNTIDKGVEGLGGVDTPMSIFATVTVIEPDDFAERLLDRERNPDWHGERMQGVYSMPDRMELWEDQYLPLWKESQKKFEDNRLSNKFYLDNQNEMDAGCKVAWPERHPNFETGIQYMMHLAVTKPVFFWSEIQNDPRQSQAPEHRTVTSSEVQRLNSQVERGVVPANCELVTGFADVQQDVAFWMLVAWTAAGGGRIVDYGSYPEQQRPYWDLRTVVDTFRSVSGVAHIGTAIEIGLIELLASMITKKIPREDGSMVPVSMVLCDEGFEQETVVRAVAKAAESTGTVGRIIPAKGFGITASGLPMESWNIQDTDLLGDHWIFSSGFRSKLPHVHVLVDSNHWKSQVHNRLLINPTQATGISIPGSDPNAHQMLADHIASNYRVPTTGRGRRVDEWKLKPGSRDDWLDCLVGSAVARSIWTTTQSIRQASQQQRARKNPASSLKAQDGRSFFLQGR